MGAVSGGGLLTWSLSIRGKNNMFFLLEFEKCWDVQMNFDVVAGRVKIL